MKVIICVDAGGTSSKAAIFDLEGNLLKRGFGGPGSPVVENEWLDNIDHSIIDAINSFGDIDIEMIQLGISGISALDSTKEICDFFKDKYNTKCVATSDTFTALYSTIDEDDTEGMVVISGTGVAAFGINNSKTYLIGGWGHMIREYGSAFAVVHDFTVSLIDKYEAGISLDCLENDFLKYLGYNDIRLFNHLFYQYTKDEIASHSSFFKEQAKLGNKHAQELLINQGYKLADQVINLMNKLNIKNGAKLGLNGGFLAHDGEYVIKGMKEYFIKNNVYLEIDESFKEQLYGVYKVAKMNLLKNEG